MKCHRCGTPLTSAVDAFGDVNALVCRRCWTDQLVAEVRTQQADQPMPGPTDDDPWPVLRWASDVTLRA